MGWMVYFWCMKYSQIPFRTSKTVSGELTSKNAQLLIRAGFIHQEIAGVYTFLPLGLRVLERIENIIREEMDKIGVEIYMPSLAPIANWVQSKRFESVDVLMKTVPANALAKSKNETEYVLSPTHEEVVTPLVQSFVSSYKDFPLAVYQIQSKFRNEPRARSGLLRCREFRMKDLYSFHRDAQDLKRYYELAKGAYWNIFERLGLGRQTTFLTLASGGDFTREYSHEFQTVCEAGEDTIFHVKSKNLTFNREIAPSKAPVIDDSQEEMRERKDVEGVGIIGVEELAGFLKLPVEKTTKTILFENEAGVLIAAAVRGGYEINEEKLRRITGSEKLVLASAKVVKKVTGAEVGFAGLLNLPKEVRIYMDESMEGRKNFEMGANRTNYHSINVNFGRDLAEPSEFYDFKIAKEGDLYPETGEKYEVYRAAEVGNIFPLNVKFSKAFGFYYTDEEGKKQIVYMGSYGIGSTRTMGVLVEKFADAGGLVWPEAVAPYQVHLIGIRDARAEEIYLQLQAAGVEVLFDDRDLSAGEKFATCDLIGIPIRLVVSPKTGGQIEFKERKSGEASLLSFEEVLDKLKVRV
jgi:prolyl-tRNA synthetase